MNFKRVRNSSVALLTGLAIFAAGCKNKGERITYFGKYDGGFDVHTVDGKTLADRTRWNLKGYLHLLASHDEFKIHLEGEQQIIDVKGIWKLAPKMITLDIEDISIDDLGGEAKRNPNLKFIPSADFKEAYGRQLSLRIEGTTKNPVLTGPTLRMGPILGNHTFRRDPRGR